MSKRSNESWIRMLREQHSEHHNRVMQELHDYLLRAVLLYLVQHRTELSDWRQEDIRALAEDMAQEALLKLLESLDTFRHEAKFTTWAYRFAINITATELRRKRYQNLSLDDLLATERSWLAAILAEHHPESLDRQLEQAETIETLRVMIAEELTERQRAAMMGIYVRGESMETVARALGIKRNALYKLLYDARQRLKRAFESRHLSPNDLLAAFDD